MSVPSKRDHGPEEGAELGRQRDAEGEEELEQLVEHRRAGGGPRSQVAGHEAGQAALQLLVVEPAPQRGDLQDGLAHERRVALADRQHHLSERRLLDRVEPAGGTEVDQPELTPPEHEDVAGVGVGVEVAVHQHLLQRAAQQGLGQRGPVHPEGVYLFGLAHADAVQPLHREDTSGGELVVDTGHSDGTAPVPHPAADERRVAGLDAEVQLLAEPIGELVGQLEHPVLGGPRRAGLGGAGQLQQHAHVPLDGGRDPRALDLHDHRLAAVEPGLVGLADRGSRHRLPVELGKQRLDGAAEVLLDDGLHGGSRLLGDSVLEP